MRPRIAFPVAAQCKGKNVIAGSERFFDGRTWHRDAVVAALRARAVETARRLGWEPTERSLLSAPLDSGFVEAFEASHQVRLPEDYRAFLLQVGDGGDGPGLYMRPLGAPFDDSAPWEEGTVHRAPGEPNELLHQPFSHTQPVHLPADATWADTTAGALLLFDHGCALWDMLVVTGPERGHIWLDRLADDEGLRPATHGGAQRVGFAEHYCRWLVGD